MPVGISYRAMLAAAGSSAAADAYIVNSFAPPVVADFAGVLNSGTEYYRVGGSDSTFDSMFTYSDTAGPRTMTDSDGNLKWAPHNFCLQSNSFSNAVWVPTGSLTLTSGQSDSDGGTDAWLLEVNADGDTKINQSDIGYTSGLTYTFEADLKYSAGNGFCFLLAVASIGHVVWFDLINGTVETESNASGSITDLGSGWYRCAITFTATVTGSGQLRIEPTDADGTSVADNGDDIYIYNARAYRSDLGGMVDNPDRGDSYVPTTTAAVYQARRNHYRWNGSSYVNKGILLESEARTNLEPYNDLTDANWTENNIATIPSANATGPDGTTSAFTLTCNSGTGAHNVYCSTIGTSGSTTYTISIYVKAGTHNYVSIKHGPSNHFWGGVFDVGASSTETAATQEITGATSGTVLSTNQEYVGNGFFRISVTGYGTNGTGNFAVSFAQAATGNSVAAGGATTWSSAAAGTETLIVYGVQTEQASTVSSFIPTSGAAVTRAAETLDVAAANMSDSTTAMSFHHQGEINYADEGAAAQQTFWRWQTDANNYLSVDLDTDSTDTGEVNANQADGGTVDTVTSDSYSPGINVAFNIATRNTNGAINLAVDGTAVTEDSTPTSLNDASSDTFQIGYDMMGTHALFRQWAADIGDTGIVSATS